MNSWIRRQAGTPAPEPAPTPPKAATVNGGEGTGASALIKATVNDALRAAAFGTPL